MQTITDSPGESVGPPGDVVIATRDHIPQIQSKRRKQWTQAVESAFLDVLSTTCNVQRACAAAGFDRSSVYARRRKFPAFAARWATARAAGYERVEELLLQTAVSSLEGWVPDPETPTPHMTVAEALAVLRLERAARADPARRGGGRSRSRTLDEMGDSILRKLSAIERAQARETGA